MTTNNQGDKVSNCKHTKSPEGYIARLEWLEKMSKRFKQVKCDKCGLYTIWRKS